MTSGEIVGLILGVVGGVIVLGVLAYFLNKFVFAKKRAKRVLREVERKYEYLHALLTGQDAQYIQRLEIISRTNLFYGNIHSEYFKRYKEIRDTQDVSYQETITKLGTLLEENKIKEFKDFYKEHTHILKNYEDTINKLNSDLMTVIKPEEDARQASLNLKEKFREVKSKFNSNENALIFVNETIQNIFEEIDRRFNEFEGLVECANYEEANQMLPDIEKVLSVTSKLIDELPNTINRFEEEIPTRITSIKETYKRMTEERYPLQNLGVTNKLEQVNTELNDIKNRVKLLNTKNVKEDLDTIDDVLADLEKSFKEEEAAKAEFDSKYESITTKFSTIERDFIKISNNMVKVKKVYIIDDEHNQMMNEIKKTLDAVSKTKTRLEMYVHSAEKTPYSILIVKTKDLEVGTQEVETKFLNFEAYLSSLKTDSELAYNNVRTKYGQLKANEYKIKSLKVNGLYDFYKEKFNTCYELLDQINVLIKAVPIDIGQINTLNSELSRTTNDLTKAIDDYKNYRDLAVDNIILINRDRLKFADINSLMNQTETLFFNGRFKDAYEMTLQILNSLESKANNN